MKFITGDQFGTALCKHLGISPGRVSELSLCTTMGEPFSVTLTALLDGDDLKAIAERLNGTPS